MGRILHSGSPKLWYLGVTYVGNSSQGVKHFQALTLELWAGHSR